MNRSCKKKKIFCLHISARSIPGVILVNILRKYIVFSVKITIKPHISQIASTFQQVTTLAQGIRL